jgi:sulfur-carrier protein
VISVLTVRYFAGARAAAGGTSIETVAAASPDDLPRTSPDDLTQTSLDNVTQTSPDDLTRMSLDDLTQILADRHGERLAAVLKAASFLVDGLACHDRQAALAPGATVDVLPPFAGG